MTTQHIFGVPLYSTVMFNANVRSDLNQQLARLATDMYIDTSGGVPEGKWNYNCGVWTSLYLTNDILHYNDVCCEHLREEIVSQILCFAEDLKITAFQKDAVSVSIQSAWFNVQQKGHFQEFHDHLSPFLQFSGVYYVQVPDPSCNIVFRHPEYRTGTLWATNEWLKAIIQPCALQVQEGQLLLFPTWLEHMVMRNECQTARISIAFNFTIDMTP